MTIAAVILATLAVALSLVSAYWARRGTMAAQGARRDAQAAQAAQVARDARTRP